ncbi:MULTISPECIES: EamA family transporter [unclassified Streptomyces]|uniref:EamA family transporter n=1 Tax=unclassified Streptomyces TaxID=2593676 RepID=UPI0033B2EB4D
MTPLDPRPRLRARRSGLPGSATGALMAVCSMSTIQLGLALSVPLLDRLGALGTTGLRLAWAGVLLLVLVRPRLRDHTGRDLLACAVLGAVSAGMMVFFMLAVTRLPLGTASALEFLGPLAVSLYGPGRGRKRWTALAAVGVVALTEPWHGGIDAVGAGFALAAAACWAAYILLTQHVGDSVTGLGGLAISMPVAGLIGLLVAAPSDLQHVTWKLLGAMLGLAALSAVLPFVLEFLALRRLTTSAFGTLMSLEPAIAVFAGLLVLGQIPGLAPAAGVAFVVIAGIGATRTGARPTPTAPGAHHDPPRVEPARQEPGGRLPSGL